jgi:hypothetical protein
MNFSVHRIYKILSKSNLEILEISEQVVDILLLCYVLHENTALKLSQYGSRSLLPSQILVVAVQRGVDRRRRAKAAELRSK